MSNPPAGPEPVVRALDEVWTSLAEACDGLEPLQWELPTDCPGWTVRDQLSHVIGTERMLLGERPPAAPATWPPHVQNELAATNEGAVVLRRARPGPEVLAEFVEVTGQRVATLQAMPVERYEEPSASPIGRVPYRDFMWLRVFDCWVHEQDVRRAVGRPGGLGGEGEAETLRRVSSAMPFAVGKKVAPPDGTVVQWEVDGLPQPVVVAVQGGRGRLEPSAVAHPTVRLTLPAGEYWRLGCGRTTADEVLAAGLATIEGDHDLGRRVIDAMAFAP